MPGSPETDVRLGVIGAGDLIRFRGWRLIDGTGATIVGVAEPDLEMRRQLVDALYPSGSEPLFFDDHGSLLDSVELDGVVIASPHGLHFEHARDSLAAGCHTLVYKPMVTSSEDARALEELVARSGRVLSIAIEGIYSAEFRAVRKLLDDGELGDVSLVTGFVAQDWLRNVQGTWRTDPVLGGGGNLIDSGYHLLAAMLHLSGQVPEEVFAFVDRREQSFDMLVAASLRFDGGALGSLAVSADAHWLDENLYLHGTERSLSTSIYGRRLAFITGWTDRDVVELPEGESPEANFVRIIRGEATTLTPARLGVDLAQVIEAIMRSGDEGRPVRVGTG